LNSSEKNKTNKRSHMYSKFREEMLEVSLDENKIVNTLVEHLYGRTDSSFKDTLWWTYGDILISNLRENIKGTKQCECCGERIEVTNNRVKYCEECWSDKEREIRKEINRKYYEKNKIKTV